MPLGADEDIYARLFDAQAAPLGASFKVNDDATPTNQHSPEVTRLSDGSFVVAWKDFRNTVTGISEIWARRFAATGDPLGASFHVDPETDGAVTPKVRAASDGSFAITYVAGQLALVVKAQRYLASGATDGDPVTLSAQGDAVSFPDLGMLFNASPKSGYLVVWQDTANGVRARCVDAAGGPGTTATIPPSKAGAGWPAVATVGVGDTSWTGSICVRCSASAVKPWTPRAKSSAAASTTSSSPGSTHPPPQRP